MKALRLLLTALATLALTTGIALAGPAKLKVKAGDTVYVCGCGEKCACKVLSLKAGKCSCGHDLAKVTVSKVERNKAYYEKDGKEQAIGTKGKYVCPCEGDCCQMISQKEGKCPCGKELVAAPEGKAKTKKKAS